MVEQARGYTEIVINDGDPDQVVEPERKIGTRYGTVLVDFVVTDDGIYEVHLDTKETAGLGKKRGQKRVQVTTPVHSQRTVDQTHTGQESYRSGTQELGRGDSVFVRTTVPQEVYRSNRMQQS